MEHSKTYRPLYAYDLWNRMGNNCDGYSLNFMLQKAKILSRPKESSTLLWKGWSSKKKNKTKLKVGEIYLNDLLDTTSTYSGIKNARNCSINTIYWKQTSLYWITQPAHTRYPIPTHDPKGNQGTYEETSSPKRR